MNKDFLVTSEEELREMYGQPIELVTKKMTASPVEEMIEFIQLSPLVFLSTVDKNGKIDVSPRGDAPGFTKIDDEGRLLIPDRPGNKLLHSHKNIISNENVGLIFVVPNLTETLRIKGRAVISRDPALLEEVSAQGKPALLCTAVETSDCWFHCGKAMIRSNMWEPEHWGTYDDSPMVRQFLKVLGKDKPEDKEAMEKEKEKNYREELY